MTLHNLVRCGASAVVLFLQVACEKPDGPALRLAATTACLLRDGARDRLVAIYEDHGPDYIARTRAAYDTALVAMADSLTVLERECRTATRKYEDWLNGE